MAPNFPNLVKNIYLQVLKAQKTPNRINMKKIMRRHIISKLLKSQKDGDNFESSLRKMTNYM